MTINRTFTAGADIYVTDTADTYVLSFLDGNDNLTIRAGTVRASMGAGADSVTIRASDAVVYGDDGADRFDVFGARATLDGGLGNDVFNIRSAFLMTATGGGGADRFNFLGDTNWAALSGGDGNDSFYGSGHVISGAIRGEAGNDTFIGFANYSWLGLYGGIGDDTYRVDPYSPALMYENVGEGTDTIQVAVGASYALADNFENLTVVNFATVSFGSVTLTGNSVANVIRGGSLDESLFGLGGNDHLLGNDGNDVLNGGDGTDFLYGGNGLDSLVGGLGSDRLYGDAGDDILDGSDGNDFLYGGAGHDDLVGGAGNDRLDGGIEDDAMDGSTGDDTYYVDSQGDGISELDGEGTDRAIISAASYILPMFVENATITYQGVGEYHGNVSDNNITDNGIAASIHGEGGDDTLIAGIYGDQLFGGAGADFLIGNAGDDLLWGGDNAITDFDEDALAGNDGNDILLSDYGADTMSGGTGNDFFQFLDPTMANNDVIVDFEDGVDSIDISNMDADPSSGDTDDAFKFIGNAAFSHTVGELRYEEVSGNTYLRGDLDGDGNADFSIELFGSHVIVSSELVL